jgi:ABC-2 type transport system permease protein
MSVQASTQRVDLGRPIKGPTALGDDPRRFFVLTKALAITDFKLRFFGSVLGYLWQLMRPFMLFGVLFTVFELFLHFGKGLKYYPVALLLGIVMYTFIGEGTGSSVRSLVTRENLVRKVDFPRLAVPLSAVLTATFSLALNMIPVLVFLFAMGGGPRWGWFELPFLLLGLTIFITGCSMLLSALFVRYRDVEPIWDVVLQMLFYATPVLWSISTLDTKPEWVRVLVFSNPFAAVLEQARHAFIDPSYPSTASAIGGWSRVAIPVGITVVLFVVGFLVFRHEAPLVAEDL